MGTGTHGLFRQGCLRMIAAAGFRMLEHVHKLVLGVAIEQSGTFQPMQVIGGFAIQPVILHARCCFASRVILSGAGYVICSRIFVRRTTLLRGEKRLVRR